MTTTLRQVAERAGVSIATASRALNGLVVSVPAQERVRRAAAELGYVANEAARSLRAERTMTVGLVFLDLRNLLGIALSDALADELEAAGYSLLIASARNAPDRYDRLLGRFLERRVDALFCINPRGDGGALAGYAAAGAPVIALFEPQGTFAQLPTISPTFADSAATLAAHLAGLGHRRAALIADSGESRPLTAIGEALLDHGVGAEVIVASEAGGMSEAIAQLRSSPHPPTALVAADAKARGLMAAAATAGLAVPGDLSIVAITDVGAVRRRRHEVSALAIDPRRMGRAAAATLLAWLAGERPPDRTLVEAATFEPGATTGPAPPAR